MMTETMKTRLSMICTGMLYFGAMLAGLAGYGWLTVIAFVGVFFLSLAIAMPEIWPHNPADWLRHETITRNGTRILLQLALVVFCFAVGRGFGGVAGAMTWMPLGLPLGLSFLSLPAALLLRRREETAKPAADDTAAPEASRA